MSVGDWESMIEAGRQERAAVNRHRARVALAVSTVILAGWLVYVTATGQWGRVGGQWVSAVTMVSGSFVAGSTPQGGGAVAFPVFTKVLDVDAEVARTFSLSIQTVGMGTAAIAIVLTRRLVAWRAVAVALPAAVVGFLVGALLLGRRDEPFWPSRLPGPYVKVTFTLLVAAMAVVVFLGYRAQLIERVVRLPQLRPRIVAALVITGVTGGVLSWLVGSGADVTLYLTIVVLLGLSPRVGIPSSVVVMAGVSIVGFVVLGLMDGQLSIGIDEQGQVTAVGGEAIGSGADETVAFGGGAPLDESRYDLFGLWLAAVPVVGFGAPLGSWAVSKVTDRQLARFVVALATAETVSTVIFLDGLVRAPDIALIVYAVLGALVVIGGLWLLERNRRMLLGLAPVDLDRSFTRSRLDTGRRFREQLAAHDEHVRDDGQEPATPKEHEGK
ncbi:MAG: sulfite exporter TauE/SafE family protein [Ilumatobacter sp.]|nr:sulfite exporter TauE/SafE family protein [Ilumatobacter sp.]